jgi:predicted membrane protein
MFLELLFGVLLILWGFSHITKTIFHFRIPVFGILFGILLMYMGIGLISGFSQPRNCYFHCNVDLKNNNEPEYHMTSMSSSHITLDNTSITKQQAPLGYKTFIGKSLIDLSHITTQALQTTGAPFIINIDTVIGTTKVLLPKNIPTRITAQSGCAKITTPDDCTIIFGTHTYNSHTHEQPLLIIYCSTICGNTHITTSL